MHKPVVAAVQSKLDDQNCTSVATQAAIAVVTAEGSWETVVVRKECSATFGSRSRFLLYSFTKTIISAAILRFVAAGHLDLAGTVERWIPEFPLAGRLRLRSLLAHASGLPDYGPLAEYHQDVRSGVAPWTEEEFLLRTRADTLLFEPGTGFAYSNIGYMLLRRMIRRIGGGDMGNVLKQQVFDPLGVTSPTVPLHRADLAQFDFGLSPYLGGDGPAVSVKEHYDPGWIATGVVGASVLDAALMLRGILGDLLPESLRAAMMWPWMRPSPDPAEGRPWRAPAYGLGLMTDTDESQGPIYGHSGGGPGCSVAVYHFPRHPLAPTVAVVTDGEDAGTVEKIAVAAAANLASAPHARW
jgi:CubicO group peptidase (beta-lactamase class C family)